MRVIVLIGQVDGICGRTRVEICAAAIAAFPKRPSARGNPKCIIDQIGMQNFPIRFIADGTRLDRLQTVRRPWFRPWFFKIFFSFYISVQLVLTWYRALTAEVLDQENSSVYLSYERAKWFRDKPHR